MALASLQSCLKCREHRRWLNGSNWSPPASCYFSLLCCHRGGNLPSLYCCLQNPPSPLLSLITLTSVSWHCARPLLAGLQFTLWSHVRDDWFFFFVISHTFPLLKQTLTQLLTSTSHCLDLSVNHVNLSLGIHDCCLNQNPHCFSCCHSLTPTICSIVDVIRFCHWQDINSLFPTLKRHLCKYGSNKHFCNPICRLIKLSPPVAEAKQQQERWAEEKGIGSRDVERGN